VTGKKNSIHNNKNIEENTMIDIANLLKTAKDANDLFSSLKKKLLAQPDEAALKLATVFEELTKIFLFIEAETVNYLCLYVRPDLSNVVECRRVLLAMEGGQLAVKGDEARGHCHKIENIYKKHLKRWFHELLEASEAEELRRLFDLLSNMDNYMVRGMQSACEWLQEEACETLNLIEDGKFDDANARIAAARLLVLQPRRDISESLRQLRALQADLIAASGTV
jgi:energy-converting hydrogenase A subunit M